MRKPDINFTAAMQRWLNTPKEERDIREGADMMLSLNRNRALYNSILRRPAQFHAKLEYELRKFLRIRLDNMTIAQVADLETQVMPSAQEVVDNPPVISTDDEIPDGTHATGRRKDHDSLPDDIKALFDNNFEVYKTVKHLFEECKSMNDLKPCDRYDKVQQLAAADARYRNNLALYDAYNPDDSTPQARPLTEEEKAEAEETAKTINAARKSLSKYKKIAISAGDDADLMANALAKMQKAVDTLIECNASFTDDYKAELAALGVSFGVTEISKL